MHCERLAAYSRLMLMLGTIWSRTGFPFCSLRAYRPCKLSLNPLCGRSTLGWLALDTLPLRSWVRKESRSNIKIFTQLLTLCHLGWWDVCESSCTLRNHHQGKLKVRDLPWPPQVDRYMAEENCHLGMPHWDPNNCTHAHTWSACRPLLPSWPSQHLLLIKGNLPFW